MKLKGPVLPAAVTFALVATAVPAAAEIVFLSSGRTLLVKGHREDGESIVLALRSGGEVTVDKTLVDKVLPDEVPFPEPPTETPAEPQSPATVQTDRLMRATPYGEMISAISEAHGVDPLLIRALIQVESAYRPRARSRKGAMGLMQLMPATAREYKVRNPYDPRTNIEAGIKHLKSLIDRFGKLELGLAAYNAGEGAVKKFNGIPPYRETRNYVSRILAIAGPR
jgi:membrane-bound lytic murein transglycosylase B